MKLEEVLNDHDMISIANKACVSYRHLFSDDEIQSCIANAAWNLVKFYSDNFNTKPSTYLYNGVVIELKKLKKSNSKNRESNTILNNYIKCPNNNYEQVDLMDEINHCKDPDMIYDRYYNRLTLQDMSNKYGMTRQGVRLRIEKNLKIMRRRLVGSV